MNTQFSTFAKGIRCPSSRFHFPEGRQSLTLPADGLPNGLISYRLLAGNSKYSGQFIKQD